MGREMLPEVGVGTLCHSGENVKSQALWEAGPYHAQNLDYLGF